MRWIILFVSVLFWVPAHSVILNVPGTYSSIQDAIKASVDGDTVLVQPGTYYENIDFNGHSIVLGSLFLTTDDTSYIFSTVIDGSWGASVVTFQSAETDATAIVGLSIQHGGADRGGGIYCRNASPLISNCRILNNRAESKGGGIYLVSGRSVIQDCFIKGNRAGRLGGGISCEGGNAVVKNTFIIENSAGGADVGNPVFGQTVLGEGGGIHTGWSATSAIVNCSVIGNRAANGTNPDRPGRGGGLFCLLPAATNVRNCILWGNQAETEPQLSDGYYTMTLEYCDVQGGWDGTGCIDSHPLFIDPFNEDFHVCSNSPCIDAGDPFSRDPDGTQTDIGVYTANPKLCESGNFWFVSVSGDDSQGAGSESDPFATIQHAINMASHGDTIIVGDGTYIENINFRGRNVVLASRYLITNDTAHIGATIIDGGGDSTVVLLENYESTPAGIIGFTIQNGDGQPGGGIRCVYTSPLISHNLIVENLGASGSGVGVYCLNSNAVVEYNRISENNGSAIYMAYSSPVIRHNSIRNNYGAAMHCDHNSRPIISGNLITGHEHSTRLLYFRRSSDAVLYNNTVAGNTPSRSIVYCLGSNPQITNCILWGNTTGTVNQIDTVSGSRPIVTYCNISGGWEGEGNFDLDPIFVGAAYDICAESPCIDAGDPDKSDPDGTRSDVGVYSEQHPGCDPGRVHHVTLDGDDESGDGSLSNPYRSIQHTIDISVSHDTILIHEGKYDENLTIIGKSLCLGSQYLIAEDKGYVQSTIVKGTRSAPVISLGGGGLTTIAGLTITNSDSAYGAGINCSNADQTIIANYITGCQDGIKCVDCVANIAGNTIVRNPGQGIYLRRSSSSTVWGNVIADNQGRLEGWWDATYVSGGIVCRESDATIANNVIARNNGFGIKCYNCNPTITNSVIWNNIGQWGKKGEIYFSSANNSPYVTYSLVKGGWEGEGNIDTNPLFAGPDYTLCSQSPCIDAGDPELQEPDGSRSDIGVYQTTHTDCDIGKRVHVSPAGNDNLGDGTVSLPYRTVQHAVDMALDGDTVVVERGTYEQHLHLKARDLLVASRYVFTQDTLDIANTIIKGNQDSSYFWGAGSIVTIEGGDRTTAIIGFTITGGPPPSSGISCIYSDATIAYNLITGNQSGYRGGGIDCRSSGPLIHGNIISQNLALNYSWGGGNSYGGGISVSEGNSLLEIRDNLIVGNIVGGVGGGIFCEDSAGTIVNNVIIGNSAGGWGGGICANDHGAGLRAVIVNNTIVGNHAHDKAGGLYANSGAIVTNNIIWANTASTDPQLRTSVDVRYCNIQGGWEGEGNIDTDPLLIGSQADRLQVCAQSPCVDAGDPALQDPDGSRSDIGVYFAEHPSCDFGNVWQVAITGDDINGDGSSQYPFRTIQRAVDTAVSKDTVRVAVGTYTENVTVSGKSIVLTSNYPFSLDTSDFQNTVIDGSMDSSVVTLIGCDSTSVITGFTIRNAANGNGIRCLSSDTRIVSNLIIRNNGAGIKCKDAHPTILQNTIVSNDGVGIACSYSSPEVRNCILWNLYDIEISHDDSSSVIVSYCNVQGGWDGGGNIDEDPVFTGPHYAVCSGSPCIHAGDPSIRNANGSRSDIGLYYPTNSVCESGRVLHVSIEGDDVSGDGSQENSWRTIQHGIDMSTSGDTVVVARGTYIENVDFGMRNICLTSPYVWTDDYDDIVRTIIDGDSISSAVTIGGCDSGTSLIGFTIRNGASNFGGGIYCTYSDPVISNCIVTGNFASGYYPRGAGIACVHSSPNIVNTEVINNTSEAYAAGLYSMSSSPIISNCSFCGNRGGYNDAGGILYSSGSLTLVNTIVWDNIANFYGRQIRGGGEVDPDIRYCAIEGGWEGVGNIDVSPGFANPFGGDYSVCVESPCIDNGDPNVLDPDGSRSDIGVYREEHPICDLRDIWFVAEGGNDTVGDGSVENPYRSIQWAIDYATTGDTVVVGKGTYHENVKLIGEDILLTSNYLFTADAEDIKNTVIDGDSISAVVTFEHCDSAAALHGFTVTNGYDSLYGGGVRSLFSSPVISHNVIVGNFAGMYGGGIHCKEGVSAEVFPTIVNNTIVGNVAPKNGGAVHTCHSSPWLQNNILWNNSGPQIEVCGSVEPNVSYCDIEGGWEGEGNIDSDPVFCDAGYDFRIADHSPCASGGQGATYMGALGVGCVITLVDADDSDKPLPSEFSLEQNYPNPFNPSTAISYALPKRSHVAVTVYNILGQRVRRLVDTDQPAGWHTIQWDGMDQRGRSVATGIYLYRITAGDFSETKKMLFLK